MKARDVMRVLNISRSTLYHYTKTGTLSAVRRSNGYFDYDENSVFSFIKKDTRSSVIYARVSSHKQKSSLDKQITSISSFCKKNNIIVDKIYSDIGSGISLDRTNLNSLINDIIALKIRTVYISHKDRLTRLSFKTIQFIFF